MLLSQFTEWQKRGPLEKKLGTIASAMMCYNQANTKTFEWSYVWQMSCDFTCYYYYVSKRLFNNAHN